MSNLKETTIAMSALLDALVTTYGVLDFSESIICIRNHFVLPQNDSELLEDLIEVLPNCRYAAKKDYLIAHRQISNPIALYMAIQKAVQETPLDFVKMSQDALSAFKIGAMPEYSVHHIKFKNMLVSDYKLDTIHANTLLQQILVQMNLDWSPSRVMEALPFKALLIDPETNKRLQQQLALVYQHTPRWLLRGHTPMSQYQAEDQMKRPEHLPTA